MNSVFSSEKPYGISSHQVDENKPGFVEWLSKQKQTPVYLCHRLDKTTTGCFVATTTAEDCAQINELWTTGKVQKVYWLITDKKPQQQEWALSSFIEKNKDQWVSTPSSTTPNATTHFKLLQSEPPYYLVEARPQTGKTHQIRLHARDSQIPLLGESLYGGSPYPVLFLHSKQIQSPLFDFQSTPPKPFENLTLLKNSLLCRWLMSYDRRVRLYPQLLEMNQCLRLVHNEGTPLRVDLLGAVAHAGWWSDQAPTESELQTLTTFFKIIGIKQWSLQNYGKERKNQNKFIVDYAPEVWLGSENKIQYEFTKSIGAAPGLFLDQREHRLWVQKNSQNKKVLNLFAYTGGFSLNAALGGASEVVTVDLSSKYKQWAQKNFALNQLESVNYKFYDMDSFDYLKYAQKKSLSFDIILCDPPSFSQGKKGRFQIDKDYANLVEMCLSLLSPHGSLLFSTNFEEWTWSQWEQKLRSNKLSQDIEIHSNFSMQWDFDWHLDRAQMKAFHLRKK